MMSKLAHRLNDFLSGFGQAFSLWPTESLDRYLAQGNPESRIYEHFARVGEQMESAMHKVMEEQNLIEKNAMDQYR
ncbi:hypothetical protein XFPR_09520 [Xylella fastidiosa]|uniref:hypothetical protein n=2 Tax=Xylella fastidiosa TaxID=2371 RepID=UPI0003D38F23|nr:hypothetical protein [Xylella fastidiosa]KXB20555.1 hypothetical protein ADT30_06730 [Xylella fastidiosa]OJZ70259.1 hypothetical protein B375_0209125 [Xylella fastidiosa 6c]QPB72933.1 hypothetical protein XFPR_09520 [Xylella fastidiosa]